MSNLAKENSTSRGSWWINCPQIFPKRASSSVMCLVNHRSAKTGAMLYLSSVRFSPADKCVINSWWCPESVFENTESDQSHSRKEGKENRRGSKTLISSWFWSFAGWNPNEKCSRKKMSRNCPRTIILCSYVVASLTLADSRNLLKDLFFLNNRETR